MRVEANRGSNPSPEELIERAHALAPTLVERSPDTNRARRLPEETILDMQKAELFRVLQPSRYGGFEMDPWVFFEIQMILAAACPSTAWVYGVVAVHSWQLALFDARAQADVWDEDTDTLISSSYMPVGKVTRVDGGFQLSGRWGFSSGSDHCDWAFLGAFVPPEEGSKRPDMRTFLVPKSDYTLVDDWHVSGLRGTGSKSVVVENAFVPAYRTHKFSDGFRVTNPGQSVNDAPLYRLPFGQLFVRSVSTGAVGMAQGALDFYRAFQAERVSRGDGARVADDPTKQVVAAEAAAVIDEIKVVLRRNFDEMMDLCRKGEKIPVDRRVQFRYESARTVGKCVEIVDGLFAACGGASIFLENRINLFFQDVHAANAHYANNPDKPGRNFGGVQFGMKNTDYFI